MVQEPEPADVVNQPGGQVKQTVEPAPANVPMGQEMGASDGSVQRDPAGQVVHDA